MNATVWYYTGLLVLLVVLCVGIVVMRPQEPFSVAGYNAMAQGINAKLQVGDATNGIFTGDPLTTGVFTNALYSPDANVLKGALSTPDLNADTSTPANYSSLFTRDPMDMYQNINTSYCQGSVIPSSMGTPLDADGNSLGDRLRCGWWYHPTATSVGAIGTPQGPLFRGSLPTGGTWMWNLAKADEAEDIKACKTLATCANALGTTTQIGSRCGFCWDSNTTGHGVPITAAGAAKYAAATCAKVIGPLDECTLTRDPPPPGTVPPVVDPDVCAVSNRRPNGTLSSACLNEQAKQGNMRPEGKFRQGVQPGADWTGDALNAINVVLAPYYRTDMWRDPIIFLQWCRSIVQAQTTGATDAIRRNAMYLVSGASLASLCPGTDTAGRNSTDYDLTCMQRAFRQAGCQPAGSKYPKAADITQAQTNSTKWGALLDQYAAIFNKTTSSVVRDQNDGIKECLGITVPLTSGLTGGVLPQQPQAFTNPPKVPKAFEASEASTTSNLLEGFNNAARGPFSLRLVNYRNYHVVAQATMGADVLAKPVPDSNPMAALAWKAGSVKDSIRIVPNAVPGATFRHRGFVLFADPDNTANDRLQAADSSFFVRGGNTGEAQTVSFESVNFPGHFLRHAGFQLILSKKENSKLFNEDSTFLPLQNGNPVGMSFFLQAEVLNGWIPLEGWLESISIGADGFMCGVNSPGNAYIRWNLNRTWEFAGGGLKSIDCGNAYSVFGTFLDGTVRQYRGGGRWERQGANPNVVHTAVASNGRYATMVDRGNGQFTFENYGRPSINCLWISLGPTENDAALVTPSRKVFLLNAKNPQGLTVENPPGLQFAKAFMSKFSGNEVLAVTPDNRLFAIDAAYKWSELKNPRKLSYFGVNQDRIVGTIQGLSAQNNIFTQVVKKPEEIPNDFKENPYSFNNGGTIVPFTQKGLGQVARECRESSKCVGFNYARDGSVGNLVLTPEGANEANNGMTYYKKSA
jgi:hypothetical protein